MLSDAQRELIEKEIYDLKVELGLIQRIVKVPKGTGRCEPGTKGRCVVCDREFRGTDCIRRCCKDTVVVIKGEKKTITTGIRVCYRCSPYIWDWQLERMVQNYSEWPERWKSYKDTGTRGERSVPYHSVFELDLKPKTEDEEYLDYKIAEAEGKLRLLERQAR